MSRYRIGTVFELVKTAVDDALEGAQMPGVSAVRTWTEFVSVTRAIDRFKSNAELYPPLSWAQVSEWVSGRVGERVSGYVSE